MKTEWTKEQGSGPLPEQFAQLNADTYIQRRNIEDAPEMEGADDPGWVCESRMISADVYEALMEEYSSATYQVLMEQNEAIDDTLGLILLNTEKEEG